VYSIAGSVIKEAESGRGTGTGDKSPAEQEKQIVARIEREFEFTTDPDRPDSILIKGQPVSKNDPNYLEMLNKINSEVTSFYKGLLAQGSTGYMPQVRARLAAMGSGGSSTSGGQAGSIPAAAQRISGQVYNTPLKGPMIWTGTGWKKP